MAQNWQVRPHLPIVRDVVPGQEDVMDASSETLRSVRMTGAIFLDAEFTAP